MMGNAKFFTIWVNGRKKSVCPKCFDYKKPQGARTHNENCKGEWESYFDKFAEFLKESVSDLRISEKNYPNFVNSFKLENPLKQEDDPGDDDMSKNKDKDQEKEKEPDEDKDKKTYGADPKEWKKDFDDFKSDFKKEMESFSNSVKDLVLKKETDDSDDAEKKEKQKKSGSGSSEASDDEEFDKKDLFLIMLVIVIIVALVGGYVGLELKGGEESPLKKKTDKKQNK